MRALRTLALALLVALPALPVVGPSAPAVAAAPAAEAKVYYAVRPYSTENVACSVLLNGVEVVRADDDPHINGGRSQLNGWVLPGKNTLVVKLWPLKHPKADPKRAYAKAVLAAVTLGADGEEHERPLVTFESGSGPMALKTPLTKTYTFEVADAPPSALWAKAARLTVNPALVAEARALTAQVHQAMAKKDAATLTRLFAFSSADQERAHYRPASLTENEMAKALTRPEMPALLPLPKALRLEPVAGGRLVRVVDASGQDPLRSAKTADGQVTLPLYLARVDGRLVIAR